MMPRSDTASPPLRALLWKTWPPTFWSAKTPTQLVVSPYPKGHPLMPSSPRKTTPFRVKFKTVGPDTGDGAGQIKALVSVFGNVDSVGDVVMPGAFTKSLARWEERGDVIPLVWAHDWDDPWSHIGSVTKATETDAGLEVDAQLDLDNPKALQIHRLMKGRRVSQFSFAYDVIGSAKVERDGKTVTALTELDVLEVGPCLLGANRATELLAIKADLAVPTTTPAALLEWAGAAPRITPADVVAWALERTSA